MNGYQEKTILMTLLLNINKKIKDLLKAQKIIILGFFLVGLLTLGSIVWMNSKKTDKQKIIIKDQPLLVEIADTPQKRKRGLSYRKSLNKDEGMLFVFEEPGIYGFSMKGMRFGLDFIWIKDQRIVAITSNVEPEQDQALKIYYPPQPIDMVLEVNAGWAEENRIEIGDEITWF